VAAKQVENKVWLLARKGEACFIRWRQYLFTKIADVLNPDYTKSRLLIHESANIKLKNFEVLKYHQSLSLLFLCETQ